MMAHICNNCDSTDILNTDAVEQLPKSGVLTPEAADAFLKNGGRIEVRHVHIPIQGFDPSSEAFVPNYKRVVTQEQHENIMRRLAEIEERLSTLEERGNYVRKHGGE